MGVEFGWLKHELVGWLVAATRFQASFFAFAVLLRGRFWVPKTDRKVSWPAGKKDVLGTLGLGERF